MHVFEHRPVKVAAIGAVPVAAASLVAGDRYPVAVAIILGAWAVLATLAVVQAVRAR